MPRTAISQRMPECDVEFDGPKGQRVVKHFADAQKAKVFFKTMDAKGKHPKVLKPATAAKPAKEAKASKPKAESKKVARDQFGAATGTLRATVNAYLAKHPAGVSTKQIIEGCKVKPAFASGHCRNLREAGVLKSVEKDGTTLHSLKR